MLSWGAWACLQLLVVSVTGVPWAAWLPAQWQQPEQPQRPLQRHQQRHQHGWLGPTEVAVWNGDALLFQAPFEWQALRGRVGTVCVTGDDRIGKSTLLTLWGQELLRRRNSAIQESAREGPLFEFSVGHERRSHTQGLWSAVLPERDTLLGYHLNLCDSQGLKQLPGLEQRRLFSATVLLPQVLVYVVVNVVQNDQLRDLAAMAQEFRRLSSADLGRLGRVLSPHLLVLVREESGLDGADDDDGDGVGGAAAQSRRNLSSHLEEALSGPAYAEDKALIRAVFQSREAWSLDELPREARRALRSASAGGGGVDALALPDAAGWRLSGRLALRRTLVALSERRESMPTGGPELVEWHRSVLDAVGGAGGDEAEVSRLIAHGERLEKVRWRQRWLRRGWDVAYAVLLGAALLLGLSRALGRLLNRLAWLAWVILCAGHLGTSPFVTVPLRGFAPSLCDYLLAGGGSSAGDFGGRGLARRFCQEASANVAALLLAVVLGVISYPLLTSQLRKALGQLPLPPALALASQGRKAGALLALAAAAAAVQLLASFDATWAAEASTHGKAASLPAWLRELLALLGLEADGSTIRLGTLAALLCATGVAGTEAACRLLASLARRGRSVAWRGRPLPWHVAERWPEVRALQATAAWASHYRRHGRQNALWRYRREPFGLSLALLTQAVGLLAWAWLIGPRVDAVLALGTFGNLAYLARRAVSLVAACARALGRLRAQRRSSDDECCDLAAAEDVVEGDNSDDGGCSSASTTTSGVGNNSEASSSAESSSMSSRAPAALGGVGALLRAARRRRSARAQRGRQRRRRRDRAVTPTLSESEEELAIRAEIEAMRRRQEAEFGWPEH
eukprot:TRINITY_DN23194_c0_g1_i1.p1 TRINITY_DN23194_c0_g1~~TRINITY_DN23194_c0_g1_i1.p1  ORF type:complete len:852 (-),score=200.99 TRINITY_DN23194_c0_g1_i1:59-2614(-)